MRLRIGEISRCPQWAGILAMGLVLASCGTTKSVQQKPQPQPRAKEYFSEQQYGVKASPRVSDPGKPMRKGGGREMVGKPYQVKGKTYVPKEEPSYNRSGLASWYGSAFHGRLTANGEVYDRMHLSAAHPTFPLPSYAKVTNLDNGSSVVVRVNDRGPFHPGRIIDVSEKTAELLDMKHAGTAKVNVQYAGRARMDGHDMPFLMASYIRKGDRLPGIQPEGQIASGVMVASAEPAAGRSQGFALSDAVPMALAGPTPSGPQFTAQSPDAFEALEALMLPEIGPFPAERPAGDFVVPLPDSSATAYAAETRGAAVPFERFITKASAYPQNRVR